MKLVLLHVLVAEVATSVKSGCVMESMTVVIIVMKLQKPAKDIVSHFLVHPLLQSLCHRQTATIDV